MYCMYMLRYTQRHTIQLDEFHLIFVKDDKVDWYQRRDQIEKGSYKSFKSKINTLYSIWDNVIVFHLMCK